MMQFGLTSRSTDKEGIKIYRTDGISENLTNILIFSIF